MTTKKLADLYTEEGENLPEIPWNEYPRPQLKRDSFFCLNGEWEFCTAKNSVIPGFFREKITVPFPPQSLLSGLHREIPESGKRTDGQRLANRDELCLYGFVYCKACKS